MQYLEFFNLRLFFRMGVTTRPTNCLLEHLNRLPNPVRQSQFCVSGSLLYSELTESRQGGTDLLGALAPYKIILFELKRGNAVLVQI
jgi:hypothetical protein